MAERLKVVAYIVIPIVYCLALCLALWPIPKGLEQEIHFGQKPPYRWVAEKTYVGADMTFEERKYTGANGKVCATMWEAMLPGNKGWTIYGYGFSEYSVTEQRAQQVAYENCY